MRACGAAGLAVGHDGRRFFAQPVRRLRRGRGRLSGRQRGPRPRQRKGVARRRMVIVIGIPFAR